MDLQEQLKNLFPDHQPLEEAEEVLQDTSTKELWIQKEPLICKYERRKGSPTTIIEGYTGNTVDFKILAKELKTTLGVGGSYKKEQIILQGDYRNEIIDILKDKGFKVKRVGG